MFWNSQSFHKFYAALRHSAVV